MFNLVNVLATRIDIGFYTHKIAREKKPSYVGNKSGTQASFNAHC